LQTTIWTLLEAGASQREIERVTGIDRKTIRTYQKRFASTAPATSPGVAADSPRMAVDPAQKIPPPRPPASTPVATTASACEPHRAFIEAQLRLRRNAMAIYQDLVDHHKTKPGSHAKSASHKDELARRRSELRAKGLVVWQGRQDSNLCAPVQSRLSEATRLHPVYVGIMVRAQGVEPWPAG
jgi:hypothetical protein